MAATASSSDHCTVGSPADGLSHWAQTHKFIHVVVTSGGNGPAARRWNKTPGALVRPLQCKRGAAPAVHAWAGRAVVYPARRLALVRPPASPAGSCPAKGFGDRQAGQKLHTGRTSQQDSGTSLLRTQGALNHPTVPDTRRADQPLFASAKVSGAFKKLPSERSQRRF